MNNQDFHKKFLAKIGEFAAFPIDTLGFEDKFFSTGLIDSVTIVAAIEFVEEYWNIRVDPIDFSIDNFDSVAAICAYVQKKRTKLLHQ